MSAQTDDSTDRLLEVLRDNGTITREEYDRLKASRAAEAAPAFDFSISTGGLEVRSADGAYRFQIHGRLHWQYAHYEEDSTQLGDGTALRRARIELRSTVRDHWHAQFQLALDDEEASIKTAALQYDGFELQGRSTDLWVGQFKEPFSISRQSSTNHLPMIERSYLDALTPSRSLGVGIRVGGRSWNSTTGLFGESASSDAESEGDEGYAITSRFTLTPVRGPENVMQFGLSASQRWLNGDRTLEVSSGPETGVASFRFLDTGPLLGTRSVTRIGVEAGLRSKNLSVVAEWVGLHATRPRDGNPDPFFQGQAITASWILTGEVRGYRFDRGVFTDLEPKGRYGAVELVARYSELDLNDDGIRGGSAVDFALGVNWYPRTNVRIMADYTFVDQDANADANGTVSGRQTPQIFETRVQLSF